MGLSQLIKYTANYSKAQTEFGEGIVLEQASPTQTDARSISTILADANGRRGHFRTLKCVAPLEMPSSHEILIVALYV
jgi:hypothetical protein